MEIIKIDDFSFKIKGSDQNFTLEAMQLEKNNLISRIDGLAARLNDVNEIMGLAQALGISIEIEVQIVDDPENVILVVE